MTNKDICAKAVIHVIPVIGSNGQKFEKREKKVIG